MNRYLLSVFIIIVSASVALADWSETTTTIADEDTIIISDNSATTGSKTKYIKFENLATDVLDKAYTPILQDTEPTVNDPKGIYFTTTGKMCIKEDTFLHCSAVGTYTPISTTYSLDLTLTGVAGLDKVTIGGTDYTSSQIITGLSGVTAITASYGDSDTLDVTGATGTYPDYSITMDDDKSAGFAFSTSGGGASIIPDSDDISTANWRPIDVTVSSATTWTEDGTSTSASLKTANLTVTLDTVYTLSFEYISAETNIKIGRQGFYSEPPQATVASTWTSYSETVTASESISSAFLQFILENGVASTHTASIRNLSLVEN